MITNNQIIKFIQEEFQNGNLEKVIDEFDDQIRKLNPSNDEKQEPVLTQEEAEKINSTIYPIAADILSIKDVEQPKIGLYDDSPGSFAITYALQTPKTLFSAPIIASTAIGVISGTIPLAAVIFGGATVIELVKRSRDANNSAGYSNIVLAPKEIFVKANKKEDFIYSTAHEITHSIHGQTLSLINRLKQNRPEYSMSCEGVAEVVAHDTCMALNINENDNLQYESLGSSSWHLEKAYHKMCDLNNIQNSDRRQKKGINLSPQEYVCDDYDLGFAGVELLKRKNGNQILTSIVRGEPINI